MLPADGGSSPAFERLIAGSPRSPRTPRRAPSTPGGSPASAARTPGSYRTDQSLFPGSGRSSDSLNISDYAHFSSDSELWSPLASPRRVLEARPILDAVRALASYLNVQPNRSGQFEVGSLVLTAAEYQRFQETQAEIGGHPIQLQTLAAVAADRLPARIPAVRPPEIDVHALLPEHPTERDEHGRFKLGTLRVEPEIYEHFRGAHLKAAVLSSESVDTLHALTAAAQPFIVAPANGLSTRYLVDERTLLFDPRSVTLVGETGRRIPADATLLHEEVHALANPIERKTLASIPDRNFGNKEEAAVILGPEARYLAALGQSPRTSHSRNIVLRTTEPLGKIPYFAFEDLTGGMHVLGPGGAVAGHVVASDERMTELATSAGGRVRVPTAQWATVGLDPPTLRGLVGHPGGIGFRLNPAGQPFLLRGRNPAVDANWIKLHRTIDG